MVRRFQRLEPHPGRRAHRPADHHGCVHALSVALPGRGEDGHGACPGHLRGCVPRVRPAAGHPHRQRRALCFAGDCGLIPTGAVVDEAGHRARAYPAGTSGAERTARAHASHLEARNHEPDGSQSPRAATLLRSVPPRVQRAASPPGAGHAHPGPLLRLVAASLSGPRARTGIRLLDDGAPRGARRTVLLGTSRGLCERNFAGRTHRIAAHRRSLVYHLLRPVSLGTLRQSNPNGSSTVGGRLLYR